MAWDVSRVGDVKEEFNRVRKYLHHLHVRLYMDFVFQFYPIRKFTAVRYCRVITAKKYARCFEMILHLLLPHLRVSETGCADLFAETTDVYIKCEKRYCIFSERRGYSSGTNLACVHIRTSIASLYVYADVRRETLIKICLMVL